MTKNNTSEGEICYVVYEDEAMIQLASKFTRHNLALQRRMSLHHVSFQTGKACSGECGAVCTARDQNRMVIRLVYWQTRVGM